MLYHLPHLPYSLGLRLKPGSLVGKLLVGLELFVLCCLLCLLCCIVHVSSFEVTEQYVHCVANVSSLKVTEQYVRKMSEQYVHKMFICKSPEAAKASPEQRFLHRFSRYHCPAVKGELPQ